MRSTLFAFFFALTLTISPIRSLAEVPPVPIPRTPPAPVFTEAERHTELAKRRTAVAAAMKDKSMLILFSAERKLYANDVDYVFRQQNDLYYLTALRQYGSMLVITKDGTKVTETLFLPRRIPLREAWNGKMYSREEATALSGLDRIVDASEAAEFLDAVKSRKNFASKDNSVTIGGPYENLYLLLPDSPQDSDGLREYRVENDYSKGLSGYSVQNAQLIFAELRHTKSPYELKFLQHAIDITTEAFLRSMAAAPNAKWEYEVHAEVEYTFRKRNADSWGYPSIVACGSNATTLHYEESQSPVKSGELLLMDVGAEYEHYSADVTRTFPVNGKFTKEQADIYQIVYDAQEAVAKAARPGVTMRQLDTISRNKIAEGLSKLGLVFDYKPPTTPEEALLPRSEEVNRWYIHSLGHWLGMNVHDVGRYGAPLRAGMTFTNEPGIYIRENALDNIPDTPEGNALRAKLKQAFEKYKNIGVRIEDDMLVTATGVEWLTAKLPRSMADIETFMAKASKETPYRQ